MIAHHCDANLILAEPFTSRKDTNRLLAYDKIMQRLTDNKLIVDLQIIDNKASAEYKRAIKTKWNADDSSDRHYLSDTMMLRNEGEVEDL